MVRVENDKLITREEFVVFATQIESCRVAFEGIETRRKSENTQKGRKKL